MIAVRCARIPATLPKDAAAGLLLALSPRGRATLARRLSAGRGLESLTGLAILAGFARARRLPPLAGIRWTRRGKPYFPDGQEFSIAHSRGLAACAIAPRGVAIGVDIEPEGRARIEAVRLVADDTECDDVARGIQSATRLWTCKEAVVKAAGARLTDMRRVRIEGDRATFNGIGYHLRSRNLGEGFLLTIASSVPVAIGRVFWPRRLL